MSDDAKTTDPNAVLSFSEDIAQAEPPKRRKGKRRNYDTTVWCKVPIGDTLKATVRMSAAQVGAWFRMYLDYWCNGPPPDDDAILARITGMSGAEWQANRAPVAAMFVIEDDGSGKRVWRNGDWNLLRAEADDFKQMATERATHAANARHHPNGKDEPAKD